MRSVLSAVIASGLIASLTPTLASAQAPAQPATPAALGCDGLISGASSRADLVKTFGAANVTDEEIPGAEGQKEKVTLLFGKDPARRLIVYMDNASPPKVAAVHVKKPSGWAGPLGMKAEMPLAEIARLNGAALTISGFESDFGGYALDLKGKLGKLPGGCTLVMRFNPGIDLAPASKYKPLIGEKKLKSDNALLLSVKPYLAEWSINYGD